MSLQSWPEFFGTPCTSGLIWSKYLIHFPLPNSVVTPRPDQTSKALPPMWRFTLQTTGLQSCFSITLHIDINSVCSSCMRPKSNDCRVVNLLPSPVHSHSYSPPVPFHSTKIGKNHGHWPSCYERAGGAWTHFTCDLPTHTPVPSPNCGWHLHAIDGAVCLCASACVFEYLNMSLI